MLLQCVQVLVLSNLIRCVWFTAALWGKSLRVIIGAVRFVHLVAFLNSELAVLLSETTYNWVNTKFHKLTFSVLYSCSHSTISVQKPLAQQRWHLILQQTPGSWILVPPRPRTRTANTSFLAPPPDWYIATPTVSIISCASDLFQYTI